MQAHPYYDGFVDYGDAETYREELDRLRAELAKLDLEEEKEEEKAEKGKDEDETEKDVNNDQK